MLVSNIQLGWHSYFWSQQHFCFNCVCFNSHSSVKSFGALWKFISYVNYSLACFQIPVYMKIWVAGTSPWHMPTNLAMKTTIWKWELLSIYETSHSEQC